MSRQPSTQARDNGTPLISSSHTSKKPTPRYVECFVAAVTAKATRTTPYTTRAIGHRGCDEKQPKHAETPLRVITSRVQQVEVQPTELVDRLTTTYDGLKNSIQSRSAAHSLFTMNTNATRLMIRTRASSTIAIATKYHRSILTQHIFFLLSHAAYTATTQEKSLVSNTTQAKGTQATPQNQGKTVPRHARLHPRRRPPSHFHDPICARRISKIIQNERSGNTKRKIHEQLKSKQRRREA